LETSVPHKVVVCAHKKLRLQYINCKMEQIRKDEAPTEGSLTGEIYWKYGNKTVKKAVSRRILGTPFRYLPNCSDIKIRIGQPDELFKKHGIQKNIEATVEIEPHTNGIYNRYAKMQILRLKNSTDSPRKF